MVVAYGVSSVNASINVAGKVALLKSVSDGTQKKQLAGPRL